MKKKIAFAWFGLFALVAMVLGIHITGNAAAINRVLSSYTTGTVEYATLWQDDNGLIYSTDLTANRFRLRPYAFTTNATMTVNDGDQVRIGSVAGNVTLTIPSAVTAGDGYVLDIQDIGGVLDGTHTVTIATSAGNINGSSTTSLATAYGGMRLISNGTNWFKR